MPEFTEFPIPRLDVGDTSTAQKTAIRTALGVPAAADLDTETATRLAADNRRAQNYNVGSFSWPDIPDDNSIIETFGDDVSDWTNTNATFTSGAESASWAETADGGNSTLAIADPSSGDWVSYIKASANDVTGGGVNFQFYNSSAANSSIVLTLGYDWEGTSYEINRVSMAVRSAGSLIGVKGPLIDLSTTPVEVAIRYDKSHDSVSLYVKEDNKWKFYGGAVTDQPAFDELLVKEGGADGSNAELYHWLVCKPNIISVGSSITAGHNFFDPDPSHYVGDDDFDNQWQYWVSADVYPDLINTLILNAGVGSEDSSELDTRMTTLVSTANARAYIVEASANDNGAGFTMDERTANLQSIVNKIRAVGAYAILTNTIYPNSSSSTYPASAAYYKEWWAEHRSKVSANGFLDWMPFVAGAEGNLDPSYTEADGVHPNAAGFEVIGGVINRMGQYAVRGLKFTQITKTLTEDDQKIRVMGIDFIRLDSDNATAANRTFTLEAGAPRQRLVLCLVAETNLVELQNTGNVSLSSAWSPTFNDTLSLMYDSTSGLWRELYRSAN